MLRTLFAIGLALLAGCTSRHAPTPPAASLRLDVTSGTLTPSPIEWIAIVGSIRGVPFDLHADRDAISAGGYAATLPWTQLETISGVAFGGSLDGTAISEAFAADSVAATGGTLEFRLGPDLLTNPLISTLPQAPADSPLIVIDTTLVHVSASPAVPGSVELHVSNVGSAPAPGLRIVPVGPGAAAFTLVGCDGESLPAGQGCTLTATYHTAAGAQGSRLLAIAVDGGVAGMQSAIVVGTPISDPQLAISAAFAGDFGNVNLQQTSVPEKVRISNQGAETSSPVMLTLEGPDAASFTLSPGSCVDTSGAPVTLAPGKSCVATVEFTPTRVGSFAAHVVARATLGGVAAQPLVGVGQIALTLGIVGSGSFGPLELNTIGSSYTFKIQNNGSVTTGPLSYAFSQGPFRSGNYSADCQDQQSLAPGASCTFEVIVEAGNLPGKLTGTLTVMANPGGTLEVPLSADVGHYIEATVDGHALGDDIVLPSLQTLTDEKKVVTLHNVSQTDVPRVYVDSSTLSSWLRAENVDCGTTLAAGASCTFAIKSYSTFATYPSSTVTALYFAAAGEHRYFGGLWYSALQASVAHLAVPVGQDGSVKVTNVSGTNVAMPTFALAASNYTITANSCTTVLTPQQSCTVTVHSAAPNAGGPELQVSAPSQGSYVVPLYW